MNVIIEILPLLCQTPVPLFSDFAVHPRINASCLSIKWSNIIKTACLAVRRDLQLCAATDDLVSFRLLRIHDHKNLISFMNIRLIK